MAEPTDLSREGNPQGRRPRPAQKSKPPDADQQNTRSMRRLDADNRAGLDAADCSRDDPAQWPGL